MQKKNGSLSRAACLEMKKTVHKVCCGAPEGSLEEREVEEGAFG